MVGASRHGYTDKGRPLGCRCRSRGLMIWSRSRGLMIWSRRQQGRLSFWLYSVCILSALVMTVLLYPPYNLQASYKTKMSWTMHLRKKPGCGRPVLPSASPEALGQVPGGSGLGQRIVGPGQCDGRFHIGFHIVYG